MQFEINPKDTINSINKALQQFIITSWNIEDILDVYVAFDYNEVKDAFQEKFPKGILSPKPIIHLWENPIKNDNKTTFTTGNKGERLYCSYDVFIVIDENIENGLNRKRLLNKLSSELKYKFDNYAEKELGFKNIKINMSNGTNDENADHLYASQQQLSFEVYRELR